MTSTETQSTGPTFASRKPRFNHVAMSLAPDDARRGAPQAARRLLRRRVRLLRPADADRRPQPPGVPGAQHRAVRVPHRRRPADDVPAPRPLRPVGRRRVGARRDPRPRQGVAGARRPRRHHRQEGRRPRDARDHEHLRALPAADDDRDPVVGLQGHAARRPSAKERRDQAPSCGTGRSRSQGWKLEYTRLVGGRRVGAHQGARAAHRAARLPPPLGVRPRRDRAAPRAHAHVRGVHDARRARAAHDARSSSARSSRARRTATRACSPRKPRASTCSPAAG